MRLFDELARIRKLQEEKKRSLDVINSPVYIRTLYLYPVIAPLGEFLQIYETASPERLRRLKSLLTLLSVIANTFHHHANFEGDAPRANRVNHITQLVMPEFLFYAYDIPYSTAEFSDLISHITAIAAQSHPNLHLVFSSFPVATSNFVDNYVVHVQCGSTPIITPIVKVHPSAVDPVYNGYTNRDHPHAYSDVASLSARPLKDTVYRNIIPCHTVGGAQFLSIIEICNDHCRYLAYRALTRTMQDLTSNLSLTLCPNRVNLILTSNTIDPIVRADMRVSPQLTHADPDVIIQTTGIFTNPFLKDMDRLTNSMRKKLSIPSTQYCLDPHEIYIFNPPFGHQLRVVCDLNEQKLAKATQPFCEMMGARNHAIIRSGIPTQLFFSRERQGKAQYMAYRDYYQLLEEFQRQIEDLLAFLRPRSPLQPITLFPLPERQQIQLYHFTHQLWEKIQPLRDRPLYFACTVETLLNNFQDKYKLLWRAVYPRFLQRVAQIKALLPDIESAANALCSAYTLK